LTVETNDASQPGEFLGDGNGKQQQRSSIRKEQTAEPVISYESRAITKSEAVSGQPSAFSFPWVEHQDILAKG
jgi:hypothetical protein